MASLVGSGGVKSARFHRVALPSTTLCGGGETFVPDSATDPPCSVPFATAGDPLTDVQSAKSSADCADAEGASTPSAPDASRIATAARLPRGCRRSLMCWRRVITALPSSRCPHQLAPPALHPPSPK